MFRISFVLFFFPGPAFNKLWYIPLSLFFVLFIALIHLIILSFVIIYYYQYYALAHNYITRIIFYSMYFLIWIYWYEQFFIKEKPKAVTNIES
jgi:hypothetical protein